MRIRILPSALKDLSDGSDFYDRQSFGIGIYFLESIFAEIESLRIYAGIHRKEFGYFRVIAKRFPYAVYYKVENDDVEVWRVLDCRQDPKKVRDALK